MKYWIILLSIFIIPFALQAGVVEKMLFSNKEYAKQIEVKAYVLTKEQVADLFKNSDKEPIQLTVDVLKKNYEIYFIVRIKNLGESHAWGVLSCRLKYIHNPFKIPIISINDQFCDYVICVNGLVLGKAQDSSYPDISYEWTELYTK